MAGELSGRNRFEIEVLDLSATGCLVRCPVGLDRGLIMDLSLEIEGQPFAAKVRVAEASRDGEADQDGVYLVGLEFLSVPPQGERQLRGFLQQERRRRQSAT
jgi:c-di-GMP-binding flagellar brake protein YcgR